MTRAPVRPAHRDDLPALTQLWLALVEQHVALDPVYALHAGAAKALERELARALAAPDAALFVAADADGRVQGFCAARIERSSALVLETCRGEITELVVDPATRGVGHGRALAEAAFAWARSRGAPRVEVRVAARNEGGRAFWRSLGFGPFVDVLDRPL